MSPPPRPHSPPPRARPAEKTSSLSSPSLSPPLPPPARHIPPTLPTHHPPCPHAPLPLPSTSSTPSLPSLSLPHTPFNLPPTPPTPPTNSQLEIGRQPPVATFPRQNPPLRELSRRLCTPPPDRHPPLPLPPVRRIRRHRLPTSPIDRGRREVGPKPLPVSRGTQRNPLSSRALSRHPKPAASDPPLPTPDPASRVHITAAALPMTRPPSTPATLPPLSLLPDGDDLPMRCAEQHTCAAAALLPPFSRPPNAMRPYPERVALVTLLLRLSRRVRRRGVHRPQLPTSTPCAEAESRRSSLPPPPSCRTASSSLEA